MGDFVELELNAAPRVATVRIKRPPMNAISTQVTRELGEVCDELARTPDVGGVVIWGGPKIFAAGADVKEFADFGPAGAAALSVSLNATFEKFANLPQVTVAAVCGFALGGGCELAMCADFRVMADDARFGQPEVLLGIIPGGGGTQRMPRLVGITRAKEIMYSGRQVNSDEAVAIGLASESHGADRVYERSLEMAAQFGSGPAALANLKAAVDGGVDQPLSQALALEATEFGNSFGTADAAVGIASFLENGPGRAEFKGS
jgi:enoyl-CoA hydratase/carnithine racemase